MLKEKVIKIRVQVTGDERTRAEKGGVRVTRLGRFSAEVQKGSDLVSPDDPLPRIDSDAFQGFGMSLSCNLASSFDLVALALRFGSVPLDWSPKLHARD